eukprot:6199494-Pleurochrysis_carterae.AAC.2
MHCVFCSGVTTQEKLFSPENKIKPDYYVGFAHRLCRSCSLPGLIFSLIMRPSRSILVNLPGLEWLILFNCFLSFPQVDSIAQFKVE